MEQNNNQTTTGKILGAISDLLREFTDDVVNYPARMLYYKGLKYENIIKKVGWRKDRNRFAKFINDLRRRGYLKIKIEKDSRAVILTSKGFEKTLKIDIQGFTKKKRRDGKWQMIIWDIPENYRKTRNRFRTALKLLGYQQLQESVWVCPYDVLKETEKLIRFYSIESYIRLFLISEIEI